MKLEGLMRDAAWAAGGVALAALAYLAGSANGSGASLDAAAVASLAKEKAGIDADYRRTSDALKKATDSVSANKARLLRLDGYEARTKGLQVEIANRQGELATVSGSLTDKRSELESLTGKIERERRKPIELPAGHFTVGRDIRPGRYTVVGDSNFIVNDGAKVNAILGDGGVDRYVCDLADGDEIEAGGADSFYPMD